MLKKRKGNSGFTLIELIIVVAILAILVGLLAPNYTKYVKKSKVTKCEAQRAEIEKAYQIGCIEDAALAACIEQHDLDIFLQGKNMIRYLSELGFYDEKEVKCPVYGNTYGFNLISDVKGGKGTAQVICPCVNSLLNYIQLAQKIFDEDYKDKNNMPREAVIEKFYNQRGSLLEVPDDVKVGTNAQNVKQKLYWRPYVLWDGSVVLYASPGNNSKHAGWRACLLYKDGKIYETDEEATANEKDPGAHIDSLRLIDKNGNYTFEDWLTKDEKGKRFAQVNKN